jgi:hypothetical protein
MGSYFFGFHMGPLTDGELVNTLTARSLSDGVNFGKSVVGSSAWGSVSDGDAGLISTGAIPSG